MQEWEDVIQHAKKAYNEHSYTDAIRLNQSALLISKRKFEHLFMVDHQEKAVASILISYFNMIDSYKAQNSFNIAENLFEDIFDFLYELSSRPSHNDKQLSAIMSGFRQLNIEWSLYIKNHSLCLNKDKRNWTTKIPSLLSYPSKSNENIH